MEDDLNPLKQEVKTISVKMNAYAFKMEDMENRLRRNNVRILGLSKRCGGSNPIGFMEKWLMETFGKDVFSPFFAIERAHRVPYRVPLPGVQPRAFLVKLLFFKDKETIHQKARERRDIYYNGVKILFFPDFSAVLQKKRAKLVEVKKKLQQLKIVYAMLYTSRLQVVALGEMHFFMPQMRRLCGWRKKKRGYDRIKSGAWEINNDVQGFSFE